MANKKSEEKAAFEVFKQDFEKQPEVKEKRAEQKREGGPLSVVTPATVRQDEKNKQRRRK